MAVIDVMPPVFTSPPRGINEELEADGRLTSHDAEREAVRAGLVATLNRSFVESGVLPNGQVVPLASLDLAQLQSAVESLQK